MAWGGGGRQPSVGCIFSPIEKRENQGTGKLNNSPMVAKL